MTSVRDLTLAYRSEKKTDRDDPSSALKKNDRETAYTKPPYLGFAFSEISNLYKLENYYIITQPYYGANNFKVQYVDTESSI